MISVGLSGLIVRVFQIYNPLNSRFIFVMLLLCCYSGLTSALTITQENPTQIAKSTAFSITPSVDSVAPRWLKVSGPGWVNINPDTGEISGTTPAVGEAHYVTVKATTGAAQDEMTFILIVGSQNVFYMDGSSGNPSTLTEAYTMMVSGDVLIIPDGTYTGVANTFNGNSSVIIDSGTAFDYTTWIAENPGQATLPSLYSKGAEYVAYKGLHFVPSAYPESQLVAI